MDSSENPTSKARKIKNTFKKRLGNFIFLKLNEEGHDAGASWPFF